MSLKNPAPHNYLSSDGNGGYVWRSDMDRFQGHVAAKLENIHEELQELKKDRKEEVKEMKACVCENNEKINANSIAINGLKTKMAMIGTAATIVVYGLLEFLQRVGGKFI